MTRTTSSAAISRRELVAVPMLAGLISTVGTVAGFGGPGPREAAAATTTATRKLRLRLPEPTGRYAVGSTRLEMVDQDRSDPWHDTDARRALMVSVFYPTRGRLPGPYAESPYLLPGEAATFDDTAANLLFLGLPEGAIDWAAVRTHVRADAPVAAGRHPVVLYSPGLGEPRTFATGIVAELASRGYVVVTIDHTFESPAVEFPDGTVARMLPPAPDPRTWVHTMMGIRVADVRFVLDQLAALAHHEVRPLAVAGRVPRGLAEALDLDRVGMFGKSAGGSAALLSMAADRRIWAGINFDGNLGLNPMDPVGDLPAAVTDGVDRPFLLLASDTPENDTVPSWEAFMGNRRGWKRWLTLLGSRHHSYSDAESFVSQAAGPLRLPSATVVDDIGTIPPHRAIAVENAYVAVFFDHWLKDRPTRLFDHPSPRYPEMSLEH
ncbi:alpha/beta hydrolase family protein [Actinopolymorpha pittospori]|uniref:Dienelactone hydrolase n=1 Tax=Actinopolymorpha pittospori TaxID=648752 RepID=A0A927RIG2_9ACTN|nr:Tat pathway signal protein [Actinopolymorpha pittospori]MBE1606151.1 dienelactone hydrolase [Actinopolymorpha pittospori]